jgi:polar amino acid transport system permease protein
VQLIFWYNLAALLPRISLGIPFGPDFHTWSTNDLITPLVAAIVGLSMHEMAYMAEVIRAGVIAVPDGQIEAARSLGMSRYQLFRRVVLPQASRFIVPPTGSQVIMMLKATSLVSVIAMRELLYSVQETYNQTFQVIPLLTVAVLWYLIVTSLLAFGQMYLERRLGRGYGKQGGRGEEAATTESPQIDLKITDRLS